jgi:hypothetical protein
MSKFCQWPCQLLPNHCEPQRAMSAICKKNERRISPLPKRTWRFTFAPNLLEWGGVNLVHGRIGLKGATRPGGKSNESVHSRYPLPRLQYVFSLLTHCAKTNPNASLHMTAETACTPENSSASPSHG